MASPIVVTIPHNLSKAEARARIASGFDRLKSQLGAAPMSGLRQAWEGDRLTFQAQTLGQTLAARIDVREKDVRIEIDLPAFLRAIAEKIAGKVQREGRLLLEHK